MKYTIKLSYTTRGVVSIDIDDADDRDDAISIAEGYLEDLAIKEAMKGNINIDDWDVEEVTERG